MIKLSILICSLFNRHESLDILLDILDSQKNNQVEILIEKDNGTITIGTKRNVLLKRAQGEYVCFIDDDDLVSNDYVSKILEAIKSNPDCCGIEGLIFLRPRIRDRYNPKKRLRGQRVQRKFIHSIRYKTWFEEHLVYYRCPNHLNPVKKELALQVMFASLDDGEDRDYSIRLLPLLKTETYIKGIIYNYLAS